MEVTKVGKREDSIKEWEAGRHRAENEGCQDISETSVIYQLMERTALCMPYVN